MPSIVQFRDKSHVLGIYSTPQRKIEEGLEYLRIGFEENNEAIVMVTDELTKEEVRNEIIKKWNTSKYDLQDLERNSIINIKTPKETYFSSAIIDYEKTIKQFSDIAHASLKKGKKGLRSFADMKIFFETEHEEQLIEYEKSLPHSFDFPIIGLCAYDLDNFVKLDYKSRKIIFDHHNLHLTDNEYRSIFDISDNTASGEHICMLYEDNRILNSPSSSPSFPIITDSILKYIDEGLQQNQLCVYLSIYNMKKENEKKYNFSNIS